MGMMPVRLTRPSVGLMPTSDVVRRRDDRAVGFGSDGRRAQVGRDRGARSGARARRVAVERVGVARLPAAAAPSARRVRRAEVRPLAEVRLAEDHRARRSQPSDDERVCRGRRAGERQRTGRRHHAIARGDVVLDQDRDAVERSAYAAGTAFGVESVGDRGGVRVDFEDAAELGAAPVDRVNPRQILLDERPGRLHARFHPPLQLGDRHLVEIEGRDAGRLRRQRRDRQRYGCRQDDESFPRQPSLFLRSPRDHRSPRQAADHHGRAEKVRDVRDPVIQMQRVGHDQEALPVVTVYLGARLTADERELQGRGHR